MGLFCHNCHTSVQKSQQSMMRMVQHIPLPMRVCIKCQNLLEYQYVNRKHAIKYYGLNPADFTKCNVRFIHGRGQMVNQTEPVLDDYTNAHVCLQIAKIKYGQAFERRTIQQIREIRTLNSLAPNTDFSPDVHRFEQDEILYNATINSTNH